jgi:DNA-binding PadR family transcriptional regulator|tara:strand:- start:34 stop:210 length:177 start_codon:yes stop_codon:yes gene_type:complete
MAKIVQTLTRPGKEYKKEVFDAIIRDIDAIVQKLNSTFQQDLKEELERKELFMNRYDC